MADKVVANAIQDTDPENWVRCNQDELRRRAIVHARASEALNMGKNVVIDRTNIDYRQRAEWLLLANEFRDRHPEGPEIRTCLVLLDTPIEVSADCKLIQECRQRLAKRTNHPSIKTPENAMRILSMFQRTFARPETNKPEGYDCMVVLNGRTMPADSKALQDYSLKLLHQLDLARKLPRAGQVVYADQPFASTPRRRKPTSSRPPRAPQSSSYATKGTNQQSGSRTKTSTQGSLDQWVHHPQHGVNQSSEWGEISSSNSVKQVPRAPLASASTLHLHAARSDAWQPRTDVPGHP